MTSSLFGTSVFHLSSLEELQALVKMRKSCADMSRTDEMEEDRVRAEEGERKDDIEVDPKRGCDMQKQSRLKGGRRRRRGKEKQDSISGCMQCLKDTNYTKVWSINACSPIHPPTPPSPPTDAVV